MKYFKKLTGKKVYLSPLCIEDANKLAKWSNDPALAAFLNAENRVVSLAAASDELSRKAREGQNLAIVDASTHQLIGLASLSDIDHRNRIATLNVFFADLDHWTNDISLEAVHLMLDYGFNIHNVNNILTKLYPYNEDMKKCYEKCGFKVCAKRREAVIKGNRMEDLVYMDILFEEFDGPTLITL